MEHKHKAEHRSVTNSGTLTEVCACGATRVSGVKDTKRGTWHTCRRCTHPWGIVAAAVLALLLSGCGHGRSILDGIAAGLGASPGPRQPQVWTPLPAPYSRTLECRPAGGGQITCR